MLLVATPTHANTVDSFFDIWTEPLPPEGGGSVDSFFDVDYEINVCNPCETIRDDIDDVMAEIGGLETDLEMLDDLMTALEADMAGTDEQLQDAQERLAEFNDPQNYVESEGRRYDSSDHAAMQRRSSDLWGAYQAGGMTVQEYSNEIAKPFDDPDVQRELDALKQEIRKEMEQNIKDLKKRKADQEKKHKEWDELGQDMTENLDALEAELVQLRLLLENCLKLCAEPEPPTGGLVQDPFGLPVPEPGFFDRFFGGLFGPPSILPPLPPLPELSGENVPTELLPMGLSGPPPALPVPDSFFDLPQVPPPTCRVCDPIREQIKETEESLAQLKWDRLLADLLVELLYDEKAERRQTKDQLEQDLDALQNPTDYAESDGRRYDGADHAAMKVRNARLWGEYKAGDLSVQELSDEWGKPFDDPEVQEELDDIKEQMEEEIEDRIEELDEQIEELNEEIEETDNDLADLAGRIAAHETVLDSLYKQLEECEKRCLAPAQEDTGLIIDFDELTRDIGITLRQTTDGTQVTRDDEDDMGIELGLEGSSSSVSESSSPEEDVGMINDQDDDDVRMDTRPSDFEPKGFLCGVPFLRNFTCDLNESNEYNLDDIDDEDDMDDVEVARDGFFCNSFNLFCPKQGLNLDAFIGCLEDAQQSVCDQLQTVVEDDVDIPIDLRDFSPILIGKNGTEFPLIVNGMDGNDDLSIGDLEGFNDCIQGGPPSCGGLEFGLPGDDVLFGDGLRGAGPGDFDLGLRGQDGNDILLGDPLPRDFIHVGGGSNDILSGGPGSVPDDLIGPGGDDILGGPPGLDIIGDPPPSTSEPSLQNDPQVKQVVEAAVRRYLQSNPLGECEKLQVQVSRVRIGNRVRYTVRITRIRDDALCPPPPVAQCPEQTSYQSIGTGCDACQNGNAGCTVIETLPDGMNCILCAPPSDEDDLDLGCQFDEECADGDECTRDYCNRQTGQCSNPQIPGCGEPVCGNGVKEVGEDCEQGIINDCGSGMTCNVESCTCEPKLIPKAECPDFAHETQSACARECNGDCRLQKYEDADCYFCVPNEEPVKVSCDRPYMEKPECDRSCDGDCSKTYTTSSGTECFSCIEVEAPVCGDGSVDPGEECDLSGCDSGYYCAADCTCQEEEDTGPSCPSGTVSDLSACQSQCGDQGGTCVDEDQTGCYSCVVVNCPEGSSKECPSSCGNGCDVVGEQYGVSCYQCKQSCEDVCAQNGYGGPETDHSSAILSELNGYSCVSGASISIQTATVGSCSCIGEYSLSVDQTPPVCTGTPCGDVTCGSSATCTEGDTTVTVNCNWGGWEKIDKHQFRPVVGN